MTQTHSIDFPSSRVVNCKSMGDYVAVCTQATEAVRTGKIPCCEFGVVWWKQLRVIS